MNELKNRAQREELIIDYLYGELDAQQQALFQHALQADRELREMLEEQMALDGVLPKGQQPFVSDERAHSVHKTAVHELQPVQQVSLLQRLRELFDSQVSVKVQFASMALMFAFGLLINSVINASSGAVGTDDRLMTVDSELGALGFVNAGDYQLLNANLDHYNQQSGDVQFSFSLASESKVEGNLDDPKLRELLAQSLKLRNSDDLRLELTEVFGDYIETEDVRKALIYSLANDPNPGVRYNAVEQLVKLVHKPDVRQALLTTLISEVNPGIRVEAFLALSEEIDAAFLSTIKAHSLLDANTLIRERSKRILEQHSSPEHLSERQISI